MLLSLADSLFRLFRDHSDVVPVKKLARDGVRNVTVLDWRRVDELIAKAVDQALAQRGVELPQEALEGVNKAAREAFARLLAQRDTYRDSAAVLEQQRSELAQNLELLKAELTAAKSRLDSERRHDLKVDEVAVGRAGIESFARRLRHDLAGVLQGAAQGGAGATELAARVEALALGLLEQEQARALEQAARERDERIGLLERRVAKLNRMLGESETMVKRLREAKAIDPGVESIYRDVQGLDPGASRAQEKRGLLDEIFKLNVELRGLIDGGDRT